MYAKSKTAPETESFSVIISGPLLSPHEPLRPFVDRGVVEEREVVGAVDIDEGDAVAEFDRPRPGLLFEHFEGKEVKYIVGSKSPS